jgi:hypothetical protein
VGAASKSDNAGSDQAYRRQPMLIVCGESKILFVFTRAENIT